MTTWQFNPELTFEQAGADWIVLDADAGVVLRASGPAALVLTAIDATGTAPGTDLLPAHLDDTVAALAERGVIVANTTTTVTDTHAHPTDINGATTGMSRRRLISTGALAAGAATLATSAGIHTLILPTAAAAASVTVAAPTGVTATPGESQQIIVNWTNVGGATSYEVFYRTFGSSDPYSEFVPPSPPITTGPVTVTGLTNTTTYDFYVVAINATTTSEPSTPLATATPAVPPGSTWTIRSTPADNDWRSVTYGMIDSSVTSDASGTLVPGFVAVAVAEPGTGNRVMTSPDGINWTSRNAAVDNDWRSVTFRPASTGVDPLFVAVAESGDNRVMTSTNGITWTPQTSAADNGWRGVTYGEPLGGVGLFVAVAVSGTGNRVMTSPDGINWTSRNAAVDNDWLSVTFRPASTGVDPLFVAVAESGDDRVMTSPDGINWTIRTSAENGWNSVTYGEPLGGVGLFVAVAGNEDNRVMTSSDGIAWTSRNAAQDNDWQGVTYGNGVFVAVSGSGSANRVMTSTDGITWTIRTSAADNSWRSVTFGNGSFVAVSSSGVSNRVMTSP